jgi:hypothetical protein
MWYKPSAENGNSALSPTDDQQSVLDAPPPILQGPHRDFAGAPPRDFVPLRLMLRPAGPCVELVQPNTLVGRHSDADVRLTSLDVSRRHCRFVFEDGHWKIIDLNSLNGVYVNEERMHEATVYDGDTIRVGPLTFTVQIAAAQSRQETKILPRLADTPSLSGGPKAPALPGSERRAS